MSSYDALIDEAIAAAGPRLRAFVASLEAVPELGFFESETGRQFFDQLAAAGVGTLRRAVRTGVVGDVAGDRPGPTIAVIGELDALPVQDGDGSSSGARHACGHHLQLAVVAGVAAALVRIRQTLHGRVRLIGVPAEEFVDLERRLALRRAGEIEFLSGKAEMVRLGYFDDVDMAVLTHSTTRAAEAAFAIGGAMNGMVAKWVRYQGVAAHAGAAPHRGINALASALVGLDAVNAIRDTFRDEDRVRVHGVITSGGRAVNTVPSDVRLELYVRGSSRTAIEDAERRVDRALWAGALALGSTATIMTVPGYLPLRQDRFLSRAARQAALRVYSASRIRKGLDRGGSTDMGDLSHLMPTLQPWAAGVDGELHGDDFRLVDFESAVMGPARIVSRMVADLLCDGAGRAGDILARSTPPMTRDAYLRYLRETARIERLDGSQVAGTPVQGPDA